MSADTELARTIIGGLLALANGQPNVSLAMAEAALAGRPGSAHLLDLRARALQAGGADRAQISRALGDVLRAEPLHVEAHARQRAV